jgi:hypothetical protein
MPANHQINQAMKNEAAVALGKLSHSRQSEKQSAASAENGKKGGRPNSSMNQKARSRSQIDRAICHLELYIAKDENKHWRFYNFRSARPQGNRHWEGPLNQWTLKTWIARADKI